MHLVAYGTLATLTRCFLSAVVRSIKQATLCLCPPSCAAGPTAATSTDKYPGGAVLRESPGAIRMQAHIPAGQPSAKEQSSPLTM